MKKLVLFLIIFFGLVSSSFIRVGQKTPGILKTDFSMNSTETLKLAKLLITYQGFQDRIPLNFRRVGKAHDGGYVIPELAMLNTEVVIGYGISNDISFENDITRIYECCSFGFDGTCKPIKPESKKCYFHSYNIISKKQHEEDLLEKTPSKFRSLTFEQQLDFCQVRDKKLFIKMDIEGAEYEVLPDILEYADNITGITFEIHFMQDHEIAKATSLLESLNKDFILVHKHGNNCCKSYFTNLACKGYIPRVLELSYINKNLIDHYEISSNQSAPTCLDMPNNPNDVDNVFSINSNPINLSEFEKKLFSQNGEDGVLKAIFDLIGVTNKYYVEFGTQNGCECNTRNLRENHFWKGLLMDGENENKEINLHKEFITAENINSLFDKYNVPNEFDLLSIDIDYNDWHVWQAIDSKLYRPRVVVIEYNSTHLPDKDLVVQYDELGQWDGSNYFGASILALYKLGNSKGYSLVYAEKRGVNLFFIRNDILKKSKENGIEFLHANDVNLIYRYPDYGKGPNRGHRADQFNRKYKKASQLLENKK